MVNNGYRGPASFNCRTCDHRAQSDMMTSAMTPINSGVHMLCEALAKDKTKTRGRKRGRSRHRRSRSSSSSSDSSDSDSYGRRRRRRSRSHSNAPRSARKRDKSRDAERAANLKQQQEFMQVQQLNKQQFDDLRQQQKEILQTLKAAPLTAPPTPATVRATPMPAPTAREGLQEVIKFITDVSAVGRVAEQRVALRDKLVQFGFCAVKALELKDIPTMCGMLMTLATKEAA